MTGNAARQFAVSARFTLSVESGPGSGRSYRLLPPKVTIGRDPGSDIPLKDPKISRNQAVIEFKPDRVLALDVSSRGNTLVNGDPARETPLKNGDVLTIGETRLLFRIETAPAPHPRPPSAAPLPARRQQASAGASRPDPRFGAAPSPAAAKPRDKSEAAKKFRFYLIAAAVIGGFLYMINEGPKERKKDLGLRTSEEIEAEIRGSEERREVLSKKREFSSEDERRRYEEAQAHFLQGFRDFQKENYSRARRSFETARAIDPAHEMAKRYYTLATRQRDEFVARHMLEGKRYKDKNMFSRCVSSIDKALKSLGETSDQDLKIKEAKALRSECEALMKERF